MKRSLDLMVAELADNIGGNDQGDLKPVSLVPATVTALASNAPTATVQFASPTGSSYTVAGVPYLQRPKTGDGVLVAVQDTARLIVGVVGGGIGPAVPPQFFAVLASNLTATTMTDYLTQTSIGVAPVATTMEVAVTGRQGFVGVANTAVFDILDEGGASILYGDDSNKYALNNAAAEWRAMSMLGKKQYAAGATMGFRLQYKVTTSNVYIRNSVVVTFHLGSL